MGRNAFAKISFSRDEGGEVSAATDEAAASGSGQQQLGSTSQSVESIKLLEYFSPIWQRRLLS